MTEHKKRTVDEIVQELGPEWVEINKNRRNSLPDPSLPLAERCYGCGDIYYLGEKIGNDTLQDESFRNRYMKKLRITTSICDTCPPEALHEEVSHHCSYQRT